MMQRQSLIALAAFAGAAIVATIVAYLAAIAIEARAADAVRERLAEEGITWATVETDGLQVRLTGTAPNEAARYRAVNITGSLIDAARVRDRLDVAPARAIEPPRFSVEMLRNDDGIQLIGLVPAVAGEPEPGNLDEAALGAVAEQLSGGTPVTDMLETAAFPAPENWYPALNFGVEALKALPRSKISVAADRVAITAISDSEDEKRRLETELARIKPAGVAVAIDISAPRPVLTPFTLRFVKDAEGARFDACSADSDAARDRILSAAVEAGVAGKADCTIGLGVPSPSWAEAAVAAIRAVAALGAGTVTFSDADITLQADAGTPQATFDRVVGDLETALPEVFSLKATLERPADAAPAGPAEFTATLAEGGRVELRGRLVDVAQRGAVEAFAKAHFGAGKVYLATRPDETLPEGWASRVMVGIEALALLETGDLLVRADTVEVRGVTGSQRARDRITQLLSGKLGQGATFRVAVRYDEELDPLAALPTPQECATRINAVLANRKISFTPGSAELAEDAGATIDSLAEILKECPNLQMEISGHTDSQGSDGGNRALSQARAEAVLLSLQGRGVSVDGLSAVGYGEDRPIADNDTEEGREANRRIEFTLVGQPAETATASPAADQGATGVPAAGTPGAAVDTSPSLAPAEPTRRPPPRPNNG